MNETSHEETEEDGRTVIVLDTQLADLSSGTRAVVTERIEQVINTGTNDEGVESIDWTTVKAIRDHC